MMKAKLKALVLFLGGGLVAVAFLGILVRTGNSRPVASENGDTNGDGVIDVSDAVYLLRSSFVQGAPAPVAIAHDEEALARIADALEGIAYPCEKRVDRFVDHGDGTFTDTCTQLMWQRTIDEQQRSFDDAVAFVDQMDLGGHTDWRLPTRQEVLSLVQLKGNVLLSSSDTYFLQLDGSSRFHTACGGRVLTTVSVNIQTGLQSDVLTHHKLFTSLSDASGLLPVRDANP